MANGESGVSINLGGLGTVLFVVFMVLKLCQVIDWSWWWVTAPLWISAGLGILLFGICAVIFRAGVRTIERRFYR